MPAPSRGHLHPLLLEHEYWCNRLRELKLARQSLLLIPRPDLSAHGIEVDEFRVRAHDGVRLYGLRARARLGKGSGPVRLRIVGPSDLPRIDISTIDLGETEFVLQCPAGRRLEDRVLDVLRVCQVAAGDDADSPRNVRLVAERIPDEFLIASHLLADDGATRPLAPLDESAGFGSHP